MNAAASSQQKSAFLALCLATFFWGVAFVFQKRAMDYIDPYWFNTMRFATASLLMLILSFALRPLPRVWRDYLIAGGMSGAFFALGITLQQIGLVTSTAGKAGFITGFYVIIVPIFAYFLWHRRLKLQVYFAAGIALLGFYFLAITDGFTLEKGDALTFLSTFGWAGMILVADKYAKTLDSFWFASVQCVTALVICLFISFVATPFEISAVRAALPDFLFMGVFATAICFLLQLYGQKYILGTLAAIIFSGETVIAALAGWLILGEVMTTRMIFGAALIFFAILIAQASADDAVAHED